MKKIKIERLTEKDLFIPYEKITNVIGGVETHTITLYFDTDNGPWHVWLAFETTMNWTRIDDDGSEVTNTLVTDEDFKAFVEFLKAIIKQNESVNAIESL